jgi:hypothetical protein
MKTEDREWYKCRSSGNGQGLVIEAGTGRNVAVTYDESDAPLVAAAPAMLAALQTLVSSRAPGYKWHAHPEWNAARDLVCVLELEMEEAAK